MFQIFHRASNSLWSSLEKLLTNSYEWLFSKKKKFGQAAWISTEIVFMSRQFASILRIIKLQESATCHNFHLYQVYKFLLFFCQKALKSSPKKRRYCLCPIPHISLKACVRYLFIFFSFLQNDSSSKTLKNAFYFIKKSYFRSRDVQFFCNFFPYHAQWPTKK